MEFISKELLEYCESFSEKEEILLKELNRETHLKVNSPRMLSGPLQGRFLSFLSKMIKPKYALEIGTYTGYSALCIAEGVVEGGKLFTIDPNEETNAFAAQFISKSAQKEKIELVLGKAQTILPTLKQKFDLVFIDADKKNYGLYFDLIIDKVNTGGLIIADNVLWSGKILEERRDEETESIHQFNKKVNDDTRVENILLPIRDGLMLMKRK
mgnify:CR=1 FL=1